MTAFASEFTCAGHWTLAAQMAGLNPVWHRSPFPTAEKSLRRNWPRLPLGYDHGVRPKIMAGSPPCVGFTRANPNRHAQTEDRQHVLTYAQKVIEFKPEASIMEMCTGWRDFPERDQYHALFKKGGWRTAELTLDAWDFGGTQKRARAFVIASRSKDPADFQPTARKGADPVQVIRGVKDPGRYWVPDDVTKGPFGLALKWRDRRIKNEKPCYVITQSALKTIFHPTAKRSLGVNELAAIMGFPPHSESPVPPRTYWLPQNTMAMHLIGPGVDIRSAANLLRDVKEWIR